MLAAADAGAEDISDDGGVWQVTCDPNASRGCATRSRARASRSRPPRSRWCRRPPAVDDDTARKLLRLVDTLEDDDDVQEVFFNFEVPEALLEEE